jgi:apolipoprotein N-acyltransferase
VPIRALKLLWLPAVSGLLLFCSFPTINQGYLAWVGLVPLITYLFFSSGPGPAFLGGFVTGSVQFFGLLIWIPAVLAHYGGIPVVLAWVLYGLMVAMQACYAGIACALTRVCMKRAGDVFLLAFPAAWVALEYVRNFVIFEGFPWLQVGYSQTEYLPLIQISDLTGVYGVSFVILWINTGIAWAILRFGRKSAFVPILAGAILVAGTIAYGHQALGRWANSTLGARAALLQGNLSFDEPDNVLSWKFQHGYAKMAAQVSASKVDLLVIPESPSPLTFQYDTAYRQTIQDLARQFRYGVIFNNISFADGQSASRYFNSAYFLDGQGIEAGRYDKIHLVPFGEYIPWSRVFFFAETVTKDVSAFTPGTTYRIVHMGGHPVNAVICFEIVFPNLVREFIRQGSELIVNLTNDGWYGDTAAPHQHLAMSRWRSVENRRYLIRAANTGISAFVEPTGRIQVRTGILREEVCVGNFAFIAEPTFYSRHGDLFAIGCAIIMCLSLALGFRPRRGKL